MDKKRDFDLITNKQLGRAVNIGKNLRHILRKRDLKLTQVSRATGIPLQTLNNWLANQSPRNLVQVHKLCSYLHISMEHLIFGKEGVEHQAEILGHVLDSEHYMGQFEVILRRIKN